MRRVHLLSASALSAVALVALPGCPVEGEELDAHVCSHTGASPSEAVAAAADPADATDALVVEDHTIYGVDLLAGTSYVRIDADDDGTARLAVLVSGLVTGLLDEAGDDHLPEPAENEECAGDVEQFDLTLEAGTWHLEFDAAEAGEHWLVLFPGPGGHEGHDH